MPSLRFALPVVAVLCSLPAFAQVEVAPGVQLPEKSRIDAVVTVAGKPAVTQLHASEIRSNAHAGSNFARSMVYAGPHKSIEIEGVKSETLLTPGATALYLRLGQDEDADTMKLRATLIRLKPTADGRQAADFSANVFGGSHKRAIDVVEVTKTDVAGGDWLKMEPTKPLTTGEYGVVFLPKDKEMFSDRVYDFSVGGN